MNVYLASKSPRRRELLAAMGIDFTVVDAETDEHVPDGTHPHAAVELLARRKCEAGARKTNDGDGLVIGSDTLVELDGRALGKPRDEDDAVSMLMALSGKTHRVHTGVAVSYRGKMCSGVSVTAVTFRPFDEAEARAYVATGEPMDKAGAYGIQGLGGKLVSSFDGEYDNVIGFPCALVCRLIDEVQQ